MADGPQAKARHWRWVLLIQLVKRDVALRYRGAYFGLLWILISPLIMLGVFVFVFGHVFQARLGDGQIDSAFVVGLYWRLAAYNIFGETVLRSTTAVRAFPSYVKKVIFPLEVLPLVPLGTALVHAAFNWMIIAAALAWTGELSPRLLMSPLLLAPLLLFSLGLSWFLSAWGVFIKDLSQIVPPFVQMLLFLSPVFYTTARVPENVRVFYQANPLVPVIEALSAVLSDEPIRWSAWAISLVTSCAVLAGGLLFFQHTRDEFPDAL